MSEPDARQRRSILIAVSTALMAVIASVTGLNVAQPDLATAFGAGQGTVLWIINSYALTLAALLLPLGALSDRWGRRRVLLLGLSLFGIANLAAGLAWSAEVMLAARVLSGVAGAMIMPVTLAVITSTFPERERGRAVGVWTAVAGGGGVLGMFLSAALVDLASWRYLFVLPVVLVVLALVLGLRSIPESRAAGQAPFDLAGSLLSVPAVVGLVFFLHEGPALGWTAPATLAGLAAGVLGTAGFLWWELRHPAPLLDLRLFRQPGLAGGSVTLLAVFGVQAGISVVLYPFFQTVLGFSGLLATLALMPMAVMSMLASTLAPRVAERAGARATTAAGIVLAGAGLVLIALLASVDGGYPTVLPGLLAMGFGLGLSTTPATEAITAGLPADRQGVASALNDVTREFGTAIGVALLGALLTAGYRAAVEPRLAGLPGEVAGAAREGLANAVHAAGSTPELVRAAQESFVAGWRNSLWAGAALLALLLVFLLIQNRRQMVNADNEDKVARQLRLVENGEWDQAWAMFAEHAVVWKHNELELTAAEAAARASSQKDMVSSLKYHIVRQFSEGDEVMTQLRADVEQDYGAGVMRGQVHALFYFRFENGLIVRNDQYANFVPSND